MRYQDSLSYFCLVIITIFALYSCDVNQSNEVEKNGPDEKSLQQKPMGFQGSKELPDTNSSKILNKISYDLKFDYGQNLNSNYAHAAGWLEFGYFDFLVRSYIHRKPSDLSYSKLTKQGFYPVWNSATNQWDMEEGSFHAYWYNVKVHYENDVIASYNVAQPSLQMGNNGYSLPFTLHLVRTNKENNFNGTYKIEITDLSLGTSTPNSNEVYYFNSPQLTNTVTPWIQEVNTSDYFPNVASVSTFDGTCVMTGTSRSLSYTLANDNEYISVTSEQWSLNGEEVPSSRVTFYEDGDHYIWIDVKVKIESPFGANLYTYKNLSTGGTIKVYQTLIDCGDDTGMY